MDQYAIFLLLLDESALIGFALLLILAGGFIASRIFVPQITLRRVTYLWLIALLSLSLSLSQLLWALVPATADAGVLWVLLIATFGAFVLFGAGIYYGSAARSRDIKGDISSAWLGFVPLANLWLIFKAGGTMTPSYQRHAMVRYVLDPVLVFGAVIVLAVTQVLDKTLADSTPYDPTESATLNMLFAQAQSVEESLEKEARLSRARLPIRIDEITILSDIEADGHTLRIFYDVEKDISGFRSDFKSKLTAMQCAPEMFGPDINRGATVELIYRAPDGRIIETYSIRSDDCAA